MLADGRDEAGLQELDMMLAPPEEKEVIRDRANMDAMRALQGMMPPGGRRG